MPLDRAGQVDAARGPGHPVGGVGLQGLVADERQRADLVRVQVRVDEGLDHQAPGCGHHLGTGRHQPLSHGLERRDHPARAVDVDDLAGAQSRCRDDQGAAAIRRLGHGGVLADARARWGTASPPTLADQAIGPAATGTATGRWARTPWRDSATPARQTAPPTTASAGGTSPSSSQPIAMTSGGTR